MTINFRRSNGATYQVTGRSMYCGDSFTRRGSNNFRDLIIDSISNPNGRGMLSTHDTIRESYPEIFSLATYFGIIYIPESNVFTHTISSVMFLFFRILRLYRNPHHRSIFVNAVKFKDSNPELDILNCIEAGFALAIAKGVSANFSTTMDPLCYVVGQGYKKYKFFKAENIEDYTERYRRNDGSNTSRSIYVMLYDGRIHTDRNHSTSTTRVITRTPVYFNNKTRLVLKYFEDKEYTKLVKYILKFKTESLGAPGIPG